MKKYLSNLVFILVAVSLAACSSVQLPGSQSTTAQDQLDDLAAQPDQPLENRLAFGTLALEGTDQAVTPEQAQALLPLWKAVKSLSASDTASAEEIAALYEQIVEALTAEQIQAIQGLSLSPEDTRALLEKVGVEMQMPGGGGPNPEDLSQDERATRIAQFQAQGGGGQFQPGGGRQGGGGMPGGGGPGGFPPGGALPEGGGGMGRPEMQGTPDPAMGGRGGFRGGFNLLLVDPLIELLQERAGS